MFTLVDKCGRGRAAAIAELPSLSPNVGTSTRGSSCANPAQRAIPHPVLRMSLPAHHPPLGREDATASLFRNGAPIPGLVFDNLPRLSDLYIGVTLFHTGSSASIISFMSENVHGG